MNVMISCTLDLPFYTTVYQKSSSMCLYFYDEKSALAGFRVISVVYETATSITLDIYMTVV
jgi:hypothetical protein